MSNHRVLYVSMVELSFTHKMLYFCHVLSRNMQEVQLDKHVKLLDSPGIVMDVGTSDTSIILRNCVKVI